MAQQPLQETACESCNGVGWVCAATDKPADFEHGTCCNPSECEEFDPGPGCPSANGCPAGCRDHEHACCPPDDCCGGPCAAHPCWDLTT